jgi:hypothetical protein
LGGVNLSSLADGTQKIETQQAAERRQHLAWGEASPDLSGRAEPQDQNPAKNYSPL